jgi:hypothetical protein
MAYAHNETPHWKLGAAQTVRFANCVGQSGFLSPPCDHRTHRVATARPSVWSLQRLLRESERHLSENSGRGDCSQTHGCEGRDQRRCNGGWAAPRRDGEAPSGQMMIGMEGSRRGVQAAGLPCLTPVQDEVGSALWHHMVWECSRLRIAADDHCHQSLARRR